MNLSDPTLGHLLGEFGWNKGRAKALFWLWLLLLFPSLLFSFLIIGLPGLILSIYFVFRSLKRLRANQSVVLVYEQGLVDRRHNSPQISRYEDVNTIYTSAVVINGVLNYGITLELQNGQKIKIDEHVENVDTLRRLLDEQIVQLQLPSAIASYQAGNPVVFNALQVSQAGLSTGKKTLLWAEFESAEIQRMSKTVYVVIRQQGSQKEWTLQSRDTFPNLALFFAILDTVQRNQKAI